MADPDDALAALLADFLAVDDQSSQRSVVMRKPCISDAEPAQEVRPDLRAMVAEQCAVDPDRLPWPEDWFDYTDSGQIAACRALWAAALLKCVRSALGSEGANDARDGRKVALSWFRTTDFYMMAAFAGFDGVALADRLTDPARVAEIAKRLEPVRVPRRVHRGVA